MNLKHKNKISERKAIERKKKLSWLQLSVFRVLTTQK